MIVDLRPMKIYAGEEQIGEKCRKYLRGKTTMSLLPDFYLLDIHGLPDSELTALRYTDKLRVVGENDSVICSGKVEDIYIHYTDTNEIVTVSIADGTELWDKNVSLSVAKGASVLTTMSKVLGNVPVASFLAEDKRFLRGQAMVGKAPELVSVLARSVDARAFYTQSQVHVVSSGRTSSILEVTEKEILSETAIATGVYAVKTKVKGYPIGLIAMIEGDNRRMRLVSQSIDGDSWEGVWYSELLFIDEDIFGASGMGGG